MSPPAWLRALDIDFDPEELRKKYEHERVVRLRPDGNDQYLDVATDEYRGLLTDPYVDVKPRAPLNESVLVAVLGGGFGGMLQAVRLKQAGVTDIKIIDKAGGFAGTWYWNRYPGAACDVESYIYLPLLEECQFMPRERYTHAPEILEHCGRIGRQFDLYKNALFSTEILSLRYDETGMNWVIGTNKGDTIRAKYVVMSSGPLHKPKLAGIPGINSFKGISFHTSRWDYNVTGGSSKGNLDKLGDKVVGIIGTGATAVQCIPHLGASAKRLIVFQRTPSSIDLRENRPTDPEWARSLKPGWQKERMDNFERVVNGIQVEDMVRDGWTRLFSDVFIKMVNQIKQRGEEFPEFKKMKYADILQLADFKQMERVRRRVDEIVKDPKTAESLKPYYNQFCKRPCFHDEYLPTFNRPNVLLVDTRGKGVDRITENGVVANGVEYKLDILIHATGFEVGTGFTRRTGCEVYGRKGRTLSDKWANGLESMFSLVTRDFPNLFFVQQAQVGAAVNFPQITDAQVHWISHVISQAEARGAKEVEVSLAGEKEWTDHHVSVATLRQGFYDTCTPGYYTLEGQANKRNPKNLGYGLGTIVYGEKLAAYIKEGQLKGLELNGAQGTAVRASL